MAEYGQTAVTESAGKIADAPQRLDQRPGRPIDVGDAAGQRLGIASVAREIERDGDVAVARQIQREGLHELLGSRETMRDQDHRPWAVGNAAVDDGGRRTDRDRVDRYSGARRLEVPERRRDRDQRGDCEPGVQSHSAAHHPSIPIFPGAIAVVVSEKMT